MRIRALEGRWTKTSVCRPFRAGRILGANPPVVSPSANIRIASGAKEYSSQVAQFFELKRVKPRSNLRGFDYPARQFLSQHPAPDSRFELGEVIVVVRAVIEQERDLSL